MQRAKFNVKGLVQGVGFRYFVFKNARALDLSGYAGNNTDGSVDVIAEGEEQNIKQLHDLLKEGPTSARVQDVEVDISDCTGEYNGFNIY